MGKHRTSTKGGNTKTKARGVKRSESKIKKWDKPTDIPLDEQDQFHASRDKILLEGDSNGYADDDDGDEEEVFGLNGLSDDNDDDDEEDDYQHHHVPEEETDLPAAPAKKSKKKAAAAAAKKSKADSEDDELEETWGKSKSAYYSSNAYELDSDDEETNELEAQEAKRLQNKTRDAMDQADFGLEDDGQDDLDNPTQDNEEKSVPAIQHVLPADQSKESLLRHLAKTSPEALALAGDWEHVAQNLIKTKTAIEQLESDGADAVVLGMVHLHYQALLTYATTLAFYLHLRASPKYASNPHLLTAHPVMNRLLTLKQSLQTLEDLDFAVTDDSDEDDDDDAGMDSAEDLANDADQLWALDRAEGLDENELEDLLMDVDSPPPTSKRQPKKVKAVVIDPTSSSASSTTDAPKKKKRKTQTDKPIFDLVEPTFTSSSTPRTHRNATAGEDVYGETTTLLHADAADKSAHKKSLRFHTSKIESASARRAGARLRAGGGDDDIPYMERGRRESAKVPKKLRGLGGEDLVGDGDGDGGEEVGKGKKRARDDDDDGEVQTEGADGYYELVKRKKREEKETKKAEYDALVARPDMDVDGPSGPRTLTRAIMANKGLTPHRPKSVRNPRVKKRQKFEKAKRKVASQKAVYKGGVGSTGVYQGERSGISKVVKSVPLG